MLYICQHGHSFDEEELQKLTVPKLVTDEALKHHELGLCVELNTDQMIRDLMKQASEVQPERYKPLP